MFVVHPFFFPKPKWTRSSTSGTCNMADCDVVGDVLLGSDALRVHPLAFFHYTCDQRIITQVVLLGLGGISSTYYVIIL